MNFDFSYLIALVIVITIHEFSHAWVANYFGDPTAKLAGRISLNPLAHLDIVGTLMLFIIHIGWGKPVPVNPNNFAKPKRDNALTALAGPAANLILAVFIAIPLKYLPPTFFTPLTRFLSATWDVSITLFAFNMLPFPPLDGSKILGMIIPDRWHGTYERYLQNGIIYFAIFLLFDQFILAPNFQFSILGKLVGGITAFFKAFIFFGS